MIILFYIFVAAFLIQIFFLLVVFSRLIFFQENKPNKKNTDFSAIAPPSVSVVICARNEAFNLQQNLPFILEQDYPNFEVVVVNDASEDDSKNILKDFKNKYKNILTVLTIEKKTIAGKKAALTAGIKAAKNEWLLLTDADCTPLSRSWISGMTQASRSRNANIVLGYAPYRAENSWLNSFIRFETLWTAIQYLNFALAGEPYMGVGRNVLYRRQLFFEAGGFERHSDLASGDDDLFINQVATRHNTTITVCPKTFMVSDAKKTLKTYIRQKKRHLSAGVRYRFRHQIMLFLVASSQFLVYGLGFFLIALKYSTMFVIPFLGIKLSLTWWVYGEIAKKLQEKTLFYKILLLDLAFLLFYALLVPILVINKEKQPIWK